MPQEVWVSRIDGALHIRLDRADKRNAVTRSMYETMAEAIAQAEADKAIRALLFSGVGEAFCAGNDLNDFVADPPTGTDSPVFRFLRAISTAEKVLVVAVHGAALGIGTDVVALRLCRRRTQRAPVAPCRHPRPCAGGGQHASAAARDGPPAHRRAAASRRLDRRGDGFALERRQSRTTC